MRKIHKNLIFIPILAIVLVITALILTFNLSLFLPGDPVLAYLPEGPINHELYDAITEQLGLNEPLIIRFFVFPFKMIFGDWGRSLSIARGMPVLELIIIKLPRTLDLLIIPLAIGLVFGLFLGRVSIKSQSKIRTRVIQIPSLIAFAFPVFFIGMLLQFFLGFVFPIFPTTGFKSIGFPDPPYITGSRVFDSLLSGQWSLIPDYIFHLILPWISLTIPILSFTIIFVRMYHINQLNQSNDPEKRSIVPFMFYVGLGFGTIFAFLILDEITFGLAGFGQLFIDAFTNSDYWTILGSIYFIFITFVFTITISLLLFILYGHLKNRSIPKRKMVNQMKIEVNLS
jgi:peptide/nickel transport system permease protein